MLRRILSVVFCVLVGINLLVGLPSALLARFPHRQKLADCSADSFKAELKVATGPPYHLFVVLPTAGTNGVKFSGQVEISRNSELVETISIGSNDLYPTAWLKGQNCQILTWSQTNRAKLKAAIMRGQSHTFEFLFSETPPLGSSVWLSSLAWVANFWEFWVMEGIVVLVGICLLIWRKLSKIRTAKYSPITPAALNNWKLTAHRI
jgi:hypothetical protein